MDRTNVTVTRVEHAVDLGAEPKPGNTKINTTVHTFQVDLFAVLLVEILHEPDRLPLLTANQSEAEG